MYLNLKHTVMGLCLLLSITGCKKEAASPAETKKNSIQESASAQKAEISDFKEARQVDNSNEVPFELYSKMDSVSLYTEPKPDAKILKIKNSKLNNYYGFNELKDFFEIHYTIAYQPNKTIKAYVSREDFTKSSRLSLQETDLNEIRSSTINNVDDFNTKTSQKYAIVSIIDEGTFQLALGKNLNEKIFSNPDVHFDGKAWCLNLLKINKKEVDQEAEYYNQYVGFSPVTQREFFMEENSYSNESNYTAYRSSKQDEGVSFPGYPAIYPALNLIACINSNNDVGSDFTLSRYNPQKNSFENLLYLNFTNFKVADSRSLVWISPGILYCKANHVNIKNSDPARKAEYLKIELTDKSY